MRRACVKWLAVRRSAAFSASPGRGNDLPTMTMLRSSRLAAILVAGAALLVVQTGAVAQGWSGGSWYVHCTDPSDCAPADEVYRSLLEDASTWLEGLGFGAPELAPVEGWPGQLHAEVSDVQTVNRDQEPIGIYDSASRRMYLSSGHFFTMGEPGQEHDDPTYRVEEGAQFVPVHELFHAVQRGSQPGEIPMWIKEGTANAVLKAYADHAGSALRALPSYDRSYAVPLHKPSTAEAYATWRFWFDVGAEMGSPAGIAYLNDVLNEDLGDNHGLDGVDRALPGGLAAHLPRFFSKLKLAAFEPQTHRVQPPVIPATKRFPVQVKEVAGKGAEVRVAVPAGKDATVHFSLEPSHAHLHLIVDGAVQPKPVAAYNMAAGSEKTYNVVVANVAGKASDSEPRDPDLKVTLLNGCSLWAEVSGDASGSFPGETAYYNAFEDGQGVEAGMASGTGVDPGMHDHLQGLMGSLEGFAEMAEAMGLEIDEEVKEKLKRGEGEESQAVQETRAWEQELLHSGSDTFGLTLQAHPGGGLSALVGGGFNMGISGRHFMPQGPGLAGKIDLEPSMVYATAGLTDGNLEAVKFVWEPGEPGYVNVTMTKADDLPLVYGVVDAELHAQHSSDGRRPKINVQATFAAMQGFESCIR